MNIRSALLASCMGLMWSVACHAASTQREALLLEFVQDMAWLEDSSTDLSAEQGETAQFESTNAFFDDALARLDALSPARFDSLEQMSDAFASHQKLFNQLLESGQPPSPATDNIAVAGLGENSPKIRVRLENLTLNYLHIAQLVLFDELGDSDRRLPMSAQTKQRLLAFIARYPVDKENADGYLSAMWFIREGLKKWKCVDEM